VVTDGFDPGDPIVLRDLWDGRVWSARPMTMVKDEPDETVLFVWSPLVMVAAASERTGEFLRVPSETWELREQRWDRYRALSFAWPETAHAVLGFWEHPTDRFAGWYVNVQTPLQRTPFGFDTTDHFLDIVISSDLETWAWKDEDELAEAERIGLISPGDVVSIRAEGERALERLEQHRAPFDRYWSEWRPDPSWIEPKVPDDPRILEGAA
jgi:predicted RNA-binding protein associated with RNAse of E/G family